MKLYWTIGVNFNSGCANPYEDNNRKGKL